MIKSILTIVLLGVFVAVNANPPSSVYKIDLTKSNIVWTGKKVTGSHTGNIKIKSGSLVMDKDQIKSGSFEIDMNTISNTDLDEGTAKKLIGHLKSEDFFNVANFPIAKFVISKATKLSDGNYSIAGDLTVKGITKPVTFTSALSGKDVSKTAIGKVKIDRTKYDIKYGSGSFFEGLGDKTIYDDFELDLSLVFNK